MPRAFLTRKSRRRKQEENEESCETSSEDGPSGIDHDVNKKTHMTRSSTGSLARQTSHPNELLSPKKKAKLGPRTRKGRVRTTIVREGSIEAEDCPLVEVGSPEKDAVKEEKHSEDATEEQEGGEDNVQTRKGRVQTTIVREGSIEAEDCPLVEVGSQEQDEIKEEKHSEDTTEENESRENNVKAKNGESGTRTKQRLYEGPKTARHYKLFYYEPILPGLNGRYTCKPCGRKFFNMSKLQRHLPVHTNERRFKCPVCHKGFRQASTLSRHKAVHSDLRAFKCHYCNKSFNRRSTQVEHEKIHNKEKQHKCPMCNKAFHQKGNLKNHIFTHTGERPYACYICKRGFIQMSNLTMHKAHVHGADKTYACVCFCKQVFSSRRDLKWHQVAVHESEKKSDIDDKDWEHQSESETVKLKSRKKVKLKDKNDDQQIEEMLKDAVFRQVMSLIRKGMQVITLEALNEWTSDSPPSLIVPNTWSRSMSAAAMMAAQKASKRNKGQKLNKGRNKKDKEDLSEVDGSGDCSLGSLLHKKPPNGTVWALAKMKDGSQKLVNIRELRNNPDVRKDMGEEVPTIGEGDSSRLVIAEKSNEIQNVQTKNTPTSPRKSAKMVTFSAEPTPETSETGKIGASPERQSLISVNTAAPSTKSQPVSPALQSDIVKLQIPETLAKPIKPIYAPNTLETILKYRIKSNEDQSSPANVQNVRTPSKRPVTILPKQLPKNTETTNNTVLLQTHGKSVQKGTVLKTSPSVLKLSTTGRLQTLLSKPPVLHITPVTSLEKSVNTSNSPEKMKSETGPTAQSIESTMQITASDTSSEEAKREEIFTEEQSMQEAHQTVTIEAEGTKPVAPSTSSSSGPLSDKSQFRVWKIVTHKDGKNTVVGMQGKDLSQIKDMLRKKITKEKPEPDTSEIKPEMQITKLLLVKSGKDISSGEAQSQSVIRPNQNVKSGSSDTGGKKDLPKPKDNASQFSPTSVIPVQVKSQSLLSANLAEKDSSSSNVVKYGQRSIGGYTAQKNVALPFTPKKILVSSPSGGKKTVLVEGSDIAENSLKGNILVNSDFLKQYRPPEAQTSLKFKHKRPITVREQLEQKRTTVPCTSTLKLNYPRIILPKPQSSAVTVCSPEQVQEVPTLRSLVTGQGVLPSGVHCDVSRQIPPSIQRRAVQTTIVNSNTNPIMLQSGGKTRSVPVILKHSPSKSAHSAINILKTGRIEAGGVSFGGSSFAVQSDVPSGQNAPLIVQPFSVFEDGKLGELKDNRKANVMEALRQMKLPAMGDNFSTPQLIIEQSIVVENILDSSMEGDEEEEDIKEESEPVVMKPECAGEEVVLSADLS